MPSRSLDDLCPAAKKKAEEHIEACKAAGLDIVITSTRRIPLEQNALYLQGRASLDVVNLARKDAGLWLIKEEENHKVTWTMESIHLYDCAYDFGLRVNGKVHYNVKEDVNKDNIADYEQAGAIAKSLGITWGGDFPRRDMPHCQYTGGLTLEQLKAGLRPEA